jgi:hypothetical protein
MPAQDIAFGHYLEPAVMTAPGDCRPLLAGLPRGIAGLAELTAAYAGDTRLRVPDTVYNAVLNRPEPVLP